MVSCAACNADIYTEYDGSSLQKKESTSGAALRVLEQFNHDVITESGLSFCGDSCAPRELRKDPPEKDPLTALVEFFHQENTDDSLEYYRNRGWSDETITDLKLGWAPPDELKAYNHLKQNGYSVAEILSTGAFTRDEDEKPPYECMWRGRYVFPYYDENMNVQYAISRSTGSEGGGAAGYDGHPADIMSGKYTKLSKNMPFSLYEEPIFGLHSLTMNKDFALIAEGMPDAITAIQSGFPTVSPVTTQFSHEQYNDVEEIMSRHSFDTIYIVPDNEEVQDSQETREISVGLEGGLKTAAQLMERDLEADIKVVELPRPDGRRKIDLDDYLNENSPEELQLLLEAAHSPGDHEEVFKNIQETVREQLEYRENREERSDNTSRADGDYSAIYDLSILDVLPSEFTRRGDRGMNPIQHIGNSTNYFSVTEYKGSLIAHDFKRKVTYSPLTYILCELGERDVNDPTGSLSDREIWLVWKWCKENNIIPEDDPLPSAAITYIARSEFGHSKGGDDFVPFDTYVSVLKRVQNKYGLNPGRSIPN